MTFIEMYRRLNKPKESTTMYDPMTADRPEARDWEPGKVSGDGTVGFMEAMAAARAGKRVRIEGHPDVIVSGEVIWANFQGNDLVWGDGEAVRLTKLMLDARWEIEKPPPKTYTFAEAVEMMKAGKSMKPTMVKEVGCRFSVNGSWLMIGNPTLDVADRNIDCLSIEWISSPWVEVI